MDCLFSFLSSANHLQALWSIYWPCWALLGPFGLFIVDSPLRFFVFGPSCFPFVGLRFRLGSDLFTAFLRILLGLMNVVQMIAHNISISLQKVQLCFRDSAADSLHVINVQQNLIKRSTDPDQCSKAPSKHRVRNILLANYAARRAHDSI